MVGSDVVLGERSQLSFEIDWVDQEPSGTAANATVGRMAAYVGGQLIWGDDDESGRTGFEWPWIELLEHLAAAWRYIEWEEIDPLGLGGDGRAVRARAEDRWQEMPESEVLREDELLRGFERTHDLAAGLKGAWAPSIWLVRTGSTVSISAGSTTVSAPFDDLLRTLSALGEAFCSRLADSKDKRSQDAVRAWERKRSVTEAEFVGIATGLPSSLIDELKTKELKTSFGLSGFRPTELLVAARMLGPDVPAALGREVLKRIRAQGAKAAPKLEAMAATVPPLAPGEIPHRQGRRLAEWLRAKLSVGERRCDPETVLRELGVSVRDIELDLPVIDAICAWGPQHGPVVLVNTAGTHAKGANGRRATLAHELCHLLVDRGSALPLAEVKGGRVPREPEARANAFAAELLLPSSVAGDALAPVAEPEPVVERLCKRYGASRAIVAWQALNSERSFHPETEKFLRRVASRYVGSGRT